MKKAKKQSTVSANLNKLEELLDLSKDSPFFKSIKFRGIKNTKKVESDLDKELLSEIKLLLYSHDKKDRNRFIKGKLILFEILCSMNEFKTRVKY